MSHDGHECCPCLLGCGHNLGSWQEESIAPCVPELKGVRVLDALVVGPVNSISTGLVCNKSDGRAKVSPFGNISMGQTSGPKAGASGHGSWDHILKY